MKQIALLAAFVALAACGSFGAAQARTLSLAFKSGDTYKYKFTSTSKQVAGMGGTSFPVELDTSAGESVAVKSVDPSGVADLEISLNNFALKTVSAGITNTTTGISPGPIDLKVKSDGTVVSIDGNAMMSGSPLAAFAGVGGYFITAVLPDKAAKVGDTWSKTYDQAELSGGLGIHITSNSKYLRDETVNGISAAVVETKSDGAITISPGAGAASKMGVSMNGTVTTDVVSWIDPSSHRVIKSHSVTHDNLTLSFPTSPPVTNSSSAMPMLEGPLTATGDATTDLTPA